MKTQTKKAPPVPQGWKRPLAKRTVTVTVNPPATKAEALAMDKEIISIMGEMRSKWLRLGKLVKKVIDTQAYLQLGYQSMTAWLNDRVSDGESLSKTLVALRCVRALEGIPDEKLMLIGIRNAQTLTLLPEKERKSPEWIKDAANIKSEQFKEKVTARLEAREIRPEEYRTWMFRCSKDVLTLLEGAEAKIARALSIDIEAMPARRAEVWERVAVWILQIENIEVEMMGEV